MLFASIAILAASCTKETTPPNVDDSFTPYFTEAALSSYENGIYVWNLSFNDKMAYDSKSEPKGYCVDFVLNSTSTGDFPSGIPTGVFKIAAGDLSKDEMTGVSRIVNIENNNVTDLTAGTLEITKNADTYTFTFDLTGKGYVCKSSISAKVSDNLLIITNEAYNSTIKEDVTTNDYTKAFIAKRGDQFEAGVCNWDLILGTDGITIEKSGNILGTGKASQIWLTTSLDKTDITGTYAFNSTDKAMTAESGDAFFTTIQGSWWFDQTDKDVYTNAAPYYEGSITISKDGSNYVVAINATDDNIPTTNKISVNYNGAAEYYDPAQTGDFYNGEAIYAGPFAYDSPYMNWFLGLSTTNTPGTTSKLTFEMLAGEEDLFLKGLPAGDYTITNLIDGPYAPYTIIKAEVFETENFEPTATIKIVSGDVKVEQLPEDHVKITVSNVVDANGKSYSGVYTGMIKQDNQATPPMKDRVFNAASAECGFVSINSDGKALWYAQFMDEEMKTTGTDGLRLILNLTVEASQTEDKGFPIGTFEIYNPDVVGSQIGITNGESDRTYFAIYHQYKENLRSLSEGTATVTKVGDDYTVVFDFASVGGEERYAFTGNYVGPLSTGGGGGPGPGQVSAKNTASSLGQFASLKTKSNMELIAETFSWIKR